MRLFRLPVSIYCSHRVITLKIWCFPAQMALVYHYRPVCVELCVEHGILVHRFSTGTTRNNFGVGDD
jgi:hypothetical protein